MLKMTESPQVDVESGRMRGEWLPIGLVLLFGFVVIAPLLQPGYFWGAHDARHDVYFIQQYGLSFHEGILWPRWSPDWTFGYGYPFFTVYAPLATFVGVLFNQIAGLGYEASVKAVLALVDPRLGPGDVRLRPLVAGPLGRAGGGRRLHGSSLSPGQCLRAGRHGRVACARLAPARALGLSGGRGAPAGRHPSSRQAWRLRPSCGRATWSRSCSRRAWPHTSWPSCFCEARAALVCGWPEPPQHLDATGTLLRSLIAPALAFALGLGLSAAFFVPALVEHGHTSTGRSGSASTTTLRSTSSTSTSCSTRAGVSASASRGPTTRRRAASASSWARPRRCSRWLRSRRAGSIRPRLRGELRFWGLWLFVAVFLMLSDLRARLALRPHRCLRPVPLALPDAGDPAVEHPAWRALARIARRSRTAGPACSRRSRLSALLLLSSAPYLKVEIREPTVEQGPVSMAALMRFQRTSDEMTGVTAWVDPAQRPIWSDMADAVGAGQARSTPGSTTRNVPQNETLAINSEDVGTAHEQIYLSTPATGARPSPSTASGIPAGPPGCWTARTAGRSRSWRCSAKTGRWRGSSCPSRRVRATSCSASRIRPCGRREVDHARRRSCACCVIVRGSWPERAKEGGRHDFGQPVAGPGRAPHAVSPRMTPGSCSRWYDDAGFLRLLDAPHARPRSEDEVQRWFEDWQKSERSIVVCRPPPRRRHAGCAGVVGRHPLVSTGSHGWASASATASSGARATAAKRCTLMLKYGFDELNLHRIQLTVFEYNERAIALYEKLGFRREGVYREFMLRDGRRYDMYLYGLLRREWANRTGGETLADERPLILLTNDDGIASPGLLAAAEAVCDLGELLIVAPATQQTGMGRGTPPIVNGVLRTRIAARGVRGRDRVMPSTARPRRRSCWRVLGIAPRRPVAGGLGHQPRREPGHGGDRVGHGRGGSAGRGVGHSLACGLARNRQGVPLQPRRRSALGRGCALHASLCTAACCARNSRSTSTY